MKVLILVLFSAISCQVFAQSVNVVQYWKETWPNLEEFTIEKCRILIDPKLIVSIKSEQDENGYPIYGRIKVTGASLIYNITEAGGPSIKPGLIFESDTDHYFSSNELICIPNNGSIYVLERVFLQDQVPVLKKYTLVGDQFLEVKQPFYKYNATTQLNEDIALFLKETDESPLVAIVRKGQWVEIVGVSSLDDSWFLVQSPSGLIGWHHISSKSVESDGTTKQQFTLSMFDGYYP